MPRIPPWLHVVLFVRLVCCLMLTLAGAAPGYSAASVAAWGSNSYGQTNVPAGLTNATAIAAGARHNLVLRDDGTVVTWGSGAFGLSNVPPQITNAVAVVAGDAFSAALLASRKVVVWGNNIYQQTNVPADLTNAIAVAAGSYHLLALRSDGTVVAWGRNTSGQTNVPPNLSNVVAMAAGYGHNLALKADGTVVAWGASNNGQTSIPAGLGEVVAVSAWRDRSLALRGNGTVVAWGDPSDAFTALPTNLNNIAAVTAGAHHSFGLDAKGAAIGWGQNGYFQTTIPPAMQGNIRALAVGDFHTLALLDPDSLRITATLGDRQSSGHSAILRVVTIGTGLSYQWQFNGTNLPGANGAQLDLLNVQVSDGGIYSVTVATPAHSIATNAELHVSDVAPIILAQPTNILTSAGSNAVFRVVADGSWPISYQWQFNAANLTDQTNATLVLANLQLGQSGAYQCVASNAFGITSSTSATLSVEPSVLELRPSVVVVPALSNAMFHVVPGGIGPFTYQWRKSGTNLSDGAGIFGAHGSTLIVSNIQLADAGNYSVVVSNAYGLTSSPDVPLMVVPLVKWGVTWVPNGGTNLVPIPLTLTDAVAVAAGPYHDVALKADGTVVAWGNNAAGQTNVPTGLSNVTAIAAGTWHNLALRANGTVFSWGRSDFTNVPASATNIAAIAAGPLSSLFLRSNGTVIASPFNDVPVWLSNVVGIAVNESNRLALRNDGTIVAWGSGSMNVPANVQGVAGIAAGAKHCLARLWNGRVVAWGSNAYGQTNVPVGLSDVIAIAAMNHSVAVKSNGTVVAWGYNASGQTNVPSGLTNVVSISSAGGHNLSLLRLPTPSGPPTALTGGVAVVEWRWEPEKGLLVSAPEPGRAGIVAIAAGPFRTTLALKSDTSLLVWSRGFFGEWWMWEIPAAARSNVTAVTAGYLHNVVLKTDGTVVAWGDNQYGQCNVPFGLTNVVGIAAHSNYTVCVKQDGTVVAWGAAPAVPDGLSEVAAVAAGAGHTLALKRDGTVVAWGADWQGQATVPVGLQGVVAIAAGQSHSVALKRDGTVTAWGIYYDDGEGDSIPSPTTGGITAISSRAHHYFVLFNDGTVEAYGADFPPPNELAGVTAITAGGDHDVALVITNLAIVRQPTSQIVDAWQAASFVIAATGFPLNYQWRQNGVVIPGATNATYFIRSAQANHAGNYTVIVSDSQSRLTSAPPAILIVNPPAGMVIQAELKLSDRVLRLWLPTVTNQATVVESSTNLLNWEPVYLYAPPQNNFFDLSITNSAQQFFRTRTGPQ